ncbi:MAG TPA: NADH-quinone oxidoreductase subunit N [Candidatus Limnocylindrales bacterium]|nr:NADH-quinone oxidoreductase subunit N [Candidatus Limnocylindrales bacterium]
MSAIGLELGLGALILAVFFVGLFGRRDDARRAGVIAAVGLAVLLGAALRAEPAPPLFGGSFVQDELAVFAKRLFLLATLIAVVSSLTLRAPVFARRATEYYLAILTSLLGMMVLGSARELILLFVAFELMSIPLYVLAGFAKREPEAVEAALKFFLVGTVSSALIAYGLSFVYGVTRTTDVAGIAQALPSGDPLLLLGLVLALAGLGFKIAAFPFHMWVPDTYEAASAPFVGWLSVAPKAAGFVVMFRLYLEGLGEGVLLWIPLAGGLAAITIVAGNLMAIPQQNIKRMLAYSGVAHIGYMLLGFAAVSQNGTAMMLFYLVAYLFGNMGAFLVVEAVTQSEGSESIAAYRGLAQRSPLLALSMLLFLLSLGGIPFVAGFWAKLFVFWAAAQQGLYWLVLLGAILTVVALFYYLLVAKRMYIDPPEKTEPVRVPFLLGLSIAGCVAGVVILGIYPKPVVMAALRVASTLF